MPWKWNIKDVVGYPTGLVKPDSAANLAEMLPFLLNDLDWIGNPAAIENICLALIDAVKQGEQWFNQPFGGWEPNSNQFGIAPLRPINIGRTDNRWIWTSGASTSSHWSAADSFIASINLQTDQLILVIGYYNLEPVPNTLELWIQPGANKWPLWNIEQMRVMGKKYFLFPDPFIIPPRSSLTISASCRNVSTTEEAGLIGYMIAPMARLLNQHK
jgi:hypothetical protein